MEPPGRSTDRWANSPLIRIYVFTCLVTAMFFLIFSSGEGEKWVSAVATVAGVIALFPESQRAGLLEKITAPVGRAIAAGTLTVLLASLGIAGIANHRKLNVTDSLKPGNNSYGIRVTSPDDIQNLEDSPEFPIERDGFAKFTMKDPPNRDDIDITFNVKDSASASAGCERTLKLHAFQEHNGQRKVLSVKSDKRTISAKVYKSGVVVFVYYTDTFSAATSCRMSISVTSALAH